MFALLAILIVFIGIAKTAHAEWRKDIGIFRVGIITQDQSTQALDRLAPFKLALSEGLDMEVEFYRARNTAALIDALASERIEYAILSTSGYALAWTACQCVEPMVIPRSKDSTDGYHTILIARSDGPQTLEELTGEKIGILSENSITGKALISHELEKQGILLGNEKTPFVKNDTAEKTLEAFSAGQITAMVGWSSMTGDPTKGYSRGNLRQLADLYGVDVRNLRILWQSEQIPHRPHIVRKKIDGEAKEILRTVLLAMNEKDPVAYDSIERVYGGGFVPGRHERFKQIINLMEAQVRITPDQPDNKKTAEENPPLQ